jgi:arylsulfatase A-like enzyme
MFRFAGYRTGAAVANTWLRSGSGFDQGFDSYYDAPRHKASLPPWFWMLANLLDGLDAIQPLLDFAIAATAPAFTPYPTFAELSTEALQWIAEAPDQPFFLFINGMETHDPFEPPPPFRDRFDGRLRSRVPFHHVRGEVMSGREEINPRILEHLLSQYDGEIANVDRQIRDFLEGLRQLGAFDRSWIVVTSDHGEHFGEHGLLWHRTSVYESLLRVPLIVKEPGQQIGQRAAAPVQLTDLMPTLLRKNGIEPPEQLREHGLWKQRGEVFSELYYDRWIVDHYGSSFARNLFAYEQRGVKLIVSSEGAVELYDLTLDPLETHNLADELPARLEELQRNLDSLLGTLPNPPAESGGDGPDEAALQRLRSLGYID